MSSGYSSAFSTEAMCRETWRAVALAWHTCGGLWYSTVVPSPSAVGQLKAPHSRFGCGGGAKISNVLVVDDEPEIVQFVSSALEEEGFTVTTAANGRQAVDVAAQN